MIVVMAVAWATEVRDCASGEAPAAYVGEPCSGVCTTDDTRIECSPSSEIGTGFCESLDGAEAWLVSEYKTSSYENFSAWGTTSDGVDFCCFIDDSYDTIFYAYLYGGGGSDTLSLTSGSQTFHAYSSGEFLSATVQGKGCPDTITGSDDLNVNYFGFGTDYLEGGSGSDIIYGNKGPDIVNGDAGDDTIYGMGGDDLIRGGAGTDYLSGAGGTNTLCAGPTTEADYFVAVGASTFWAPGGAGSAPSGSAPSGSSCGAHSWGTSWAGSACTYGWLMTAPSSC